jgi:hypothetical protein
MAKAANKDIPTMADWQNAIDRLSPEEQEFLHRPLPEDEWLNAIARLPNTTKPLADLFRTSTPPDGVRDLLAELLDPGSPHICGGQLVFVPDDTFRQIAGSEGEGDEGLLSLAARYGTEVERRKQDRKERKHGDEGSATTVGAKIGVSGPTVYRRWRLWREIAARVRKPLK